jgi:magnesium-transporting ATPase (P-type)
VMLQWRRLLLQRYRVLLQVLRFPLINLVVNIARQGRSTLVAMIQMYKILALNSLISAYSLSVLHLAGVKQGDWQATIAGFLLTICFFGIAKSSVSLLILPFRLSKSYQRRDPSQIFLIFILSCQYWGRLLFMWLPCSI